MMLTDWTYNKRKLSRILEFENDKVYFIDPKVKEMMLSKRDPDLFYRYQLGNWKEIHSGTHLGYKYSIISNGNYPCVYAYFSKPHPFYFIGDNAHGSYAASQEIPYDEYKQELQNELNYLALDDTGSEGRIGIDYGHASDFSTLDFLLGIERNHRWTLEELINDAETLCKIIDYHKNDDYNYDQECWYTPEDTNESYNKTRFDKQILESIIDKYGKSDVITYINSLNESDRFDYREALMDYRDSIKKLSFTVLDKLCEANNIDKNSDKRTQLMKWISKSLYNPCLSGTVDLDAKLALECLYNLCK